MRFKIWVNISEPVAKTMMLKSCSKLREPRDRTFVSIGVLYTTSMIRIENINDAHTHLFVVISFLKKETFRDAILNTLRSCASTKV